jgi:protein-L-isoaspartate(D-aspartate) O-methyltransferase
MKRFTDTNVDIGRRRQLVNLLKEKGITNKEVLDAINTIPRHFFVETVFDAKAYDDIAIQIDADQTISQPYTVAFQTQLLDVKRGQKVLEVGTGSVYQASVLAHIGARVFTIERQKKLFEINKNFIFRAKYPNLKFFYGDGFAGLPTYGPFDKVIITAAAPFIPPKLIEQLKPNGVMVIPVDEGELQRMLRITKNEDGTLTEERFDTCSFVPMLTGKNG